MTSNSILLSIRFHHPTMQSREIEKGIGRQANIAYNIGDPTKPNRLGISSKTFLETYVVVDIDTIEDKDLEQTIRAANSLLLGKLSFLETFNTTGGRIDYYITAISDEVRAFVFDQCLIRDCAKLNVEIGVEFFKS